ncbi:PspA-associated protein PspAA [Propionibacteriaceae bacterium G1746]|uniref:PspA-associated protein PspAA n=1 Tax=Aestuariimicrobium sp. G57 TaxID=3418485 RepID=UPI003C1B5D9C
MIIRILGEGQWSVEPEQLDDLQSSDAKVELAMQQRDQEALTEALEGLVAHIKELGSAVPDDVLADSDLIIPDVGSTIEDVAEFLESVGSDEGLIPS